ncbi:MAG: tetratricopeptide repeat protein [Leptolyngbya sp.]|nr:tetratricopeptide repeat protein [Candidatus Melainabacteria bacterium]
MLKQALINLSVLVIAPAASFAADIDKQETIREKSGEWMLEMHSVDSLKTAKKWAEAQALVRKVKDERKELGLDVTSELSMLAKLYDSSGDKAEAEKLYKEVIAIREESGLDDDFTLVHPLNQYADFLSANKRTKEADQMQARSKAIEADINHRPTKKIEAVLADANLSAEGKYNKLCELGEKYLQADNPTKAKFVFDEAVKLNTKRARAYKLRARSNYETEKSSLALADYNSALKIEPKEAATLFSRAKVYQSLNKTSQAMKDFDASILIRPDDLDTLGYRAKQYAASGNIDRALADYTTVLMVNPRTHWGWVQRAVLFRDGKKNYVAALADIDKAIALAPKSPEDWELRVETLIKAGKQKEALEAATKMIEVDPHSTNGLSLRAALYKQLEGEKSANAAADLSTIAKMRAAAK